MADRILQLLGLPDNSPRQSTAYSGMFSGLPQPLANSTEPTYSSGGLSRVLDTPYRQSGGIVRPRDESAGFNPGSMDALLAAELKMGDRGGYSRGASAFLGSGYNPFTKEINSQGELVSNPNQNLDALFDTAQQLGLDTSKYSRDTGVGIRGERGQNDAVQLYDDLNALTKDYVAVDHMTQDGKSMERTLYRDQGGQLVPVSEPMRRSGRQDSAFFGDDFKEMLMTIGPAVLGGFMAAPAAGAGQAASTAGAAGGTAAAGGAAGATSSIPWGQIGSRALTGALQGGVQSALTGGNILQGALTGGLGGAASGAGLPSGVFGIGKRVLGGAAGMGEGSSGGGGGGSMSTPATSPAAPAGASVLVGALGGGSGAAPVGGGSGSPGQLYDPNQYRLRSSLAQALLNRSGRAGDTRGDNPLTRALGEALQG